MLNELRGKDHLVYTALALLRLPEKSLLTDFAETKVPMRDYSNDEVEEYIVSGDPLDKAGAYAIQHAGFHPVANMQGCYANVIGLPLCHLQRSLQKIAAQQDGERFTAADWQALLDSYFSAALEFQRLQPRERR